MPLCLASYSTSTLIFEDTIVRTAERKLANGHDIWNCGMVNGGETKLSVIAVLRQLSSSFSHVRAMPPMLGGHEVVEAIFCRSATLLPIYLKWW